MITFINYYLWVGLVWLVLHEIFFNKNITNGMRIRLWIFWPVTMTAWIIGFIEAWKNDTE
jgi:hypothetical protein